MFSVAKPCLLFEIPNSKFFNSSSLGYELHSAVLLLFTCHAVTEPGVPYNITVRAVTAAGLGEPVSIVVFAVQQGKVEKLYKGNNVLQQGADDCGQRVVFVQRKLNCIQCHYISHSHDMSQPSLLCFVFPIPLH